MVFVVLVAKEFLLWSIPNQNPLFQPRLQSEVYYFLWLVFQDLVKKHTVNTQFMVNSQGLILHKTRHKGGRQHDYHLYKPP